MPGSNNPSSVQVGKILWETKPWGSWHTHFNYQLMSSRQSENFSLREFLSKEFPSLNLTLFSDFGVKKKMIARLKRKSFILQPDSNQPRNKTIIPIERKPLRNHLSSCHCKKWVATLGVRGAGSFGKPHPLNKVTESHHKYKYVLARRDLPFTYQSLLFYICLNVYKTWL